MLFIPVVDIDQKPLMPTTPARACRWVISGKATPFWRKGIRCVRLNVEPSARNLRFFTLKKAHEVHSCDELRQ